MGRQACRISITSTTLVNSLNVSSLTDNGTGSTNVN